MLRVIIAGLAAYRVAELLGYEYGPFHVLERFRQALGVVQAADYGEDGDVLATYDVASTGLAEMILCPRCLSVWLGWLFAALLGWLGGELSWAFLVEGLAASGLAVFIGGWELE